MGRAKAFGFAGPQLSGTIDYTKRCIITLRPIREGLKKFDLVIYGHDKAHLMCVPNEVTPVLAARYPDYHSTLFDVKEF